MKLVTLGITEEDAGQLVRGTFDGQYELLLGAGFSMSAKDKNKRGLPSGPGLGVELNKLLELGFEEEEAKNLQVVYEEARSDPERDERLNKYLRERFVGVIPSWHGVVLKFPWSRIWTLNIDDLLERLPIEPGMFKPIPVLWTDNLSPASIALQQIQVVHLHGRASTLPNSSKSLVFALREYAKALRSQGDWHSEFWNKWVQRPFLIVGARLVEEIDLAEAISKGSQARAATGFPSIAIIKNVSNLDRKRLSRGGVVCVDADAEEFFAALAEDVDAYKVRYQEMARSPMLAGVIARFNQQYEVLGDGRSAIKSTHDYYGGDEPAWSDITEKRDAYRNFSSSALNALLGAVGLGKVASVMFTGMPGGGRSTVLLRLGQDFISEGYRVFRFREMERPDVDATVAWLKSNPKTLLLFDNAADFSGNIREILFNCRRQGVQCAVAVAERSRRSAMLELDLEGFLHGTWELGPVTRPDALRISEKRESAARMGDATGWSEKQLWKHFDKDCGGDLFMALSGLEKARGFYGRLDREWAAAIRGINSDGLSVLKAISIVNRFGYSLPISVALAISGLQSTSDLKDGLATDSDLIVLDARGYRFRHRMLAEYVFKNHLTGTEKYNLSMMVAKSLAPLVSSSSMRQRTYPVIILRQLMDKDGVMAVSSTVEKARAWYSQLEVEFGWNGRFWDQRSLLESDAGVHDKAYSYAKKSVSVHRHAFSLNTLGRVRLKASIDRNVGVNLAWDHFREGEASLSESVAHAQGFGDLHEHPFMTIFSYLSEFSERLDVDDPRILSLDQLRLKWAREVNKLGVKSPGVHVKMADAQERMLKLMIRPVK